MKYQLRLQCLLNTINIWKYTFGNALNKLFHRKNHDEHGGKTEDSEGASSVSVSKKESEINKPEDDLENSGETLKDSLHKDEELEEEGKTYGGLM
ncbi:hypothetical protein BGW36DRAFT_424611 [Talaromyces proteolyticus]|uniref:Uncharacterized protein n=1 Tax=Talaromyces proteolyticus TaxID=1131652 RepID=A0AAD4KZD0_9EURO|nr:uncharacterized protein BGW36DRAFT_424611 [Talaromyces proteolyticus]KAH8702332.1 hypothetical protein BGW36DRAFT_424611 [Talaromyces proteolyticus]